jgi:hypothetical protein
MPLLGNDTDGALTRKRLQTYIAAQESATAVAVADAAAILTAAQVLNSKIFVQTPTAARALTTPTAALLIAALTDYVVGTSFEFTIINLAAATHVATLTAGVGVTLVGVAAVQPVTSGTFVGVVTSSSAVSIYRK